MNYYQHHIGDFIRDTSRLSDVQCMAYLRLIWMYYETEEPLESDVDAIAFKIGASASDVLQILKHFFFEHEGKWHNSRCDKEILAFRNKSKKAKESANARWDNANAMRTHSKRKASAPVFDANQEPITNISKSKDLDNPDISEKPAKRAKQLPDDFHPNETGTEYAAQRGVKLDTELISFRNFHTAKGSTYKDWQAAWRTWCDKAVEFGRAGRKPVARQSAMNSIGVDDKTPEGFQDGFR